MFENTDIVFDFTDALIDGSGLELASPVFASTMTAGAVVYTDGTTYGTKTEDRSMPYGLLLEPVLATKSARVLIHGEVRNIFDLSEEDVLALASVGVFVK